MEREASWEAPGEAFLPFCRWPECSGWKTEDSHRSKRETSSIGLKLSTHSASTERGTPEFSSVKLDPDDTRFCTVSTLNLMNDHTELQRCYISCSAVFTPTRQTAACTKQPRRPPRRHETPTDPAYPRAPASAHCPILEAAPSGCRRCC